MPWKKDATMKALGFDKTANPEAKAADDLREITVPMPTIENPRELLVKVVAVGCNPVDYKVRNGGRPIVGFDASGIVVEVGAECKFFKEGDEVFYAGDIRKQGSNAEYQIIDERIVGRKPDKLTHAEAAAMPLVTLTAWEAFQEQMGISTDITFNRDNGKTILIMAGGGGVGSTAVQIAKKVFGLRVIAAASREETATFAKSLGADEIISGRGDLVEELKAVNIQDGMVDYIFDTVTWRNGNFDRYVAATKPCGRICSIDMSGPIDLNLGPLGSKNIIFCTEFMFAKSMHGVNMESQHRILNSMSKLLDLGEVRSTMIKALPWEVQNLIEMHKVLESGKAQGKTCLTREEPKDA